MSVTTHALGQVAASRTVLLETLFPGSTDNAMSTCVDKVQVLTQARPSQETVVGQNRREREAKRRTPGELGKAHPPEPEAKI